MIEITYSTLFILVTAILTTALMLSLMNNLIFIIINFISTIVGVGMILLYMDNGFVCFWLIVIYGGAITMFVMISSSITKVGAYNEDFTLNKFFLTLVASIFLIYFVSFLSEHVYNNDAPFVTVFVSETFSYSAAMTNTESLCLYLFTIYSPVLINIGVILLQVMIGTIVILLAEKF